MRKPIHVYIMYENNLPQESEIKLLPGTGHGFWGHIDEVALLLQKWFVEHLKT